MAKMKVTEVDQAIETARAEAETRAHDRISPEAAYDAIGAVNLYVAAFIAGARFEAERREAGR